MKSLFNQTTAPITTPSEYQARQDSTVECLRRELQRQQVVHRLAAQEMNMEFDEAFRLLIGHEGGFQANPADRGNWTSGKIGTGELRGTKYGVSAAAYPGEDIKGMTLDRAREIYRRDYWGPAGCDLVQGRLRFDLFDAAVHAGPHRARQLLQRALGVRDDGVIGPVTMQALSHADQGRLHARFNGHRLDHLNNDPKTWAEFGRGWAQRIATNLMES